MANMKTLIRILFVIFIANGIDCLGEVCDNCCDCFKDKKDKKKDEEENEEKDVKKDEKKDKEDKKQDKKEEKKDEEEKKEEGNITAESLVNEDWNNFKDNPPVLKIFKKNSNIFISTGNEGIISFELEGKDNNFKIKIQDGKEDEFNLGDEKYALFEIKTQKEETVYLYCSDVESSLEEDEDNNNYVYGIFEKTKHKSISVIACDTKKVKDMRSMFANCSSLTELNLQNFNTENVTDMKYMFNSCNSLKILEFSKNFNTTNVEDMSCMFYKCNSLTELNLEYFNTTNVTGMSGMFSGCNSLTELNLEYFNTANVTGMSGMFSGCISLKNLKFGKKFNTTEVTNIEDMFKGCSSFPEDIQNKLDNVKEVIKFLKKKTTKKDF